jgi:hypothetical protein
MKTIFLLTGLLRNYEYKYKNFLSKIKDINNDIYCVTWDIKDMERSVGDSRRSLGCSNDESQHNKIFEIFQTKYIKILKYKEHLIENKKSIVF